jgi:hypothetical protein
LRKRKRNGAPHSGQLSAILNIATYEYSLALAAELGLFGNAIDESGATMAAESSVRKMGNHSAPRTNWVDYDSLADAIVNAAPVPTSVARTPGRAAPALRLIIVAAI